MKIIIPMAGRGSRLRPHTLTVPKPLIPIAGKPIVQRLVEDLSASFTGQVEEIAFVIGDFGQAVERQLKAIAASVGARASIYHQDEPLGTAHAIYCAKDSLHDNCIIAFADTLFKASFAFDTHKDGIIWVQQVEDPSAFGVVQVNADNIITDFVEKPDAFVSDMAIVGIYYFRQAERLAEEIKYLLDHDIKDKGEFQITDALERLKADGLHFHPASVEEWLDCGNKKNVLSTNERILSMKKDRENLIAEDARVVDSMVIPPCYIGAGAEVKNSIVGPYVSIGNNTRVEQSVIQRSLIQSDTVVKHANLKEAMLGNKARFTGTPLDVSLGDFSVF